MYERIKEEDSQMEVEEDELTNQEKAFDKGNDYFEDEDDEFEGDTE